MKPASHDRHARIGRIFGEACALAPAVRNAFLDRACADDLELRSAVVALLAADEDEGDHGRGIRSAFESGAGAELIARAMADSGDPLADEVPERIGRYRIIRVIGEGGMGVVYEAEQEDPNRRVALKVIRRGFVSPALLKRFRHEAHVLGQLQHPGIAQIYEAGTDDSGQPFFAMEIIDGPTLLDYVRMQGLEVRDRLALMARVADAVHHAHLRGIIHRDLKPGNVLVVADGTNPAQPRILDFGVARITDADVQAVTLHTEVGQLIGTLPYMSPEQAGGNPLDIDIRSDVYALGVLTYELLTGRLPYPVEGQLIHEAVRIIREEDASRLSAINRSFRGDIETIVAKALVKDKERRYQSAAEFAADIRRFLADEPIVARPASKLYQLRKFVRRNRALVVGVAAVLAVSTLGTVIASRFALLADRSAVALAQRERSARWQSYKAAIGAASANIREGDVRSAAGHLDGAPTEYRGWEWSHLHAQLATHARNWDRPPEPVTSPPALDRGANRLYAMLADGTIATWDTNSGALISSVTAAEAMTPEAMRAKAMRAGVDARLSPTSNRYACTANDGSITIGDLSVGTPLVRLAADGSPLRPLAWDRGGDQLLLTDDKGLWLWREGTPLRKIDDVRFECAAFDPSGTRIIAARFRRDGCILFEVASSAVVATSNVHAETLLVVAFTPDGQRIVGGGKFRNIYVLDAASLDIERRLIGHRHSIASLDISEDASRLVSTDQAGSLRFWSLTADTHSTMSETDEEAGFVTLLPESSGAVVLGAAARLHRPREGNARVLRGHESFVYHIAWSIDNSMIASSTLADGTIRLWDADSAEPIARFAAPPPGWYTFASPCLQFTSDGASLVAGNTKGGSAFDLATGRSTPFEDEHDWCAAMTVRCGGRRGTRLASSIAYSPDGRYLAKGSATSGEVTVTGPDGSVYKIKDGGRECGLAFSPDSEELAIAQSDGRILRFRTQTGALEGVLKGHDGAAFAVAYHPDGTRLATGGEDGSIRLWDAVTGDQLLELREHEQYVKDVAFSPDGTMLASGSGDFTVRIWDTVERAERARRADEARRARDD